MTQVIVAHEKHGTFIYSSALVVLKQRVQDGYWYDYPEGAQGVAAAIVKEGDEAAAWRFLEARNDHEYEYVERQTVQG